MKDDLVLSRIPTNLKTYRCHKVVSAATIVGYGPLQYEGESAYLLALDDGKSVVVSEAWMRRKAPQLLGPDGTPAHAPSRDTGYFVVYKDGYTSWSTTKAFEDGYTEIA